MDTRATKTLSAMSCEHKFWGIDCKRHIEIADKMGEVFVFCNKVDMGKREKAVEKTLEMLFAVARNKKEISFISFIIGALTEGHPKRLLGASMTVKEKI